MAAEEQEYLDQVNAASEALGVRSNKFGGAVTVESLREFLSRHGIAVSPRDVFIRGLPLEIDLLVPSKDVVPEYGILYEPEQVLCVLEVKKKGAFGSATTDRIRDNFQKVIQRDSRIRCVYVTLLEREGYPHAVTEESLGFDCFTLFWHSGSGNALKRKASGDWGRLLDFLRSVSRQ